MKDLKLMNILPMALGVAVGFIVYKMVAKMIGDQNEVEAMLSARGSVFGNRKQRMSGRWYYCKCGGRLIPVEIGTDCKSVYNPDDPTQPCSNTLVLR